MKIITTFFAAAVLFASCNNSQPTTQQTKEQALKEVRDSLQLDSFRRAEVEKLEVEEANAKTVAQSNVAASSSERTYVKGVSETYTNSQPQKRGWSKAAKGAAIGAGAGAVTGIIVDKKDARGAVVGGIVGAGAGYVIGRSQDKKDGRVQ